MVKRSKSNDRGRTWVVGNGRDEFDGDRAFPLCLEEEQKPNLPLLHISHLGTQLEHPARRTKDE